MTDFPGGLFLPSEEVRATNQRNRTRHNRRGQMSLISIKENDERNLVCENHRIVKNQRPSRGNKKIRV